MSNPQYFFSIVTATLNVAGVLPALLESLAEQTCRDFNCIIQDGASTDNTLQVLELWRKELPALVVRSERDSGIYDAWNKVLDSQHPHLGEWVLFLGADDCLADTAVLSKAKKCLESVPSNVVYAIGGQAYCDENGNVVDNLFVDATKVFSTIGSTMIPHSAAFHRSCIFKKTRFDANYRFLGDWDLVWRTWRTSSDGVNIPFVVTHMSRGGATTDIANLRTLRNEQFYMASKLSDNFGVFKKTYFTTKLRILLFIVYLLGKKNAAKLLNFIYKLRKKTQIWDES